MKETHLVITTILIRSQLEMIAKILLITAFIILTWLLNGYGYLKYGSRIFPLALSSVGMQIAFAGLIMSLGKPPERHWKGMILMGASLSIFGIVFFSGSPCCLLIQHDKAHEHN